MPHAKMNVGGVSVRLEWSFSELRSIQVILRSEVYSELHYVVLSALKMKHN